MKKINISFVLVTIIFLTSCQCVKDGLSGRKSENSDEFLVQKKNPLVLPPNYESLPTPFKKKEVMKDEKELDLSKIFNNTQEKNTESSSSINQSLEDSIRKKIGTN